MSTPEEPGSGPLSSAGDILDNEGRGRVMSLFSVKGFGFIVPDGASLDEARSKGASNVFFHAKACHTPFDDLYVGARVRYALVRMPDGRLRAVGVLEIEDV